MLALALISDPADEPLVLGALLENRTDLICDDLLEAVLTNASPRTMAILRRLVRRPPRTRDGRGGSTRR